MQVVARPARVARIRVPGGDDPRVWGRVLAGRRAAVGGELVVDGLLLPEQREAVIRRTSVLEVGEPDRSSGTVAARVRDRTRLRTLSGRRRQELADRALAIVDELAAATAPAGADGDLAPVVVDTALALAEGVDLFVLSGLDGQPEPTRHAAGRLADELARRGATVLVVERVGEQVGEHQAPPPRHITTDGVTGAVRTSHD
jgi:hypothetical protein